MWLGFRSRAVRPELDLSQYPNPLLPPPVDEDDYAARISAMEAALATAQEAIAGLAARVRLLESAAVVSRYEPDAAAAFAAALAACLYSRTLRSESGPVTSATER